jgi:glutamyl-tRNA synthetase
LTSKPRVRFAPSPTGYLHVGGARTALFNWLFARRNGGTFILRVEDTDVERNKPELVDGILHSLRWLGLDWDEGPIFQSKRLDMYRAAADRLLASNHAYHCYCAPEKYAGGDAAQETDIAGGAKEKAPVKKAKCPCRHLHEAGRKAAADRAHAQGYAPAVRFCVPETGVTRFGDAVFGPREVQNAEMEDFVVLRSPRPSSGQALPLPTYQLGCVVDDVDMRITHVVRGADHLSNTPKQVLIYQAMGVAPPIFAHVPLILGADRTRLSKRHGATSVGSYEEEGFLAEAFRNFLALLGWSAGGDAEAMRTPELIERFSLEGVSRTNAVFDRAKLEWYNTHYLQTLPLEELLPLVENVLRAAGIWKEEWATGADGRAGFARTVDLLRPRTRYLPDFANWGRGFFNESFTYDPAAVAKFWKDRQLPALFSQLVDALAALPDWNHDACDKALRDVAAAAQVKAGLLINAARVAMVGQAVAPPLFDSMVAIGQAQVVARIRKAIPMLDPAAH